MVSDTAQDPARPMGFAGLRDLPAPPLPDIAEPPAEPPAPAGAAGGATAPAGAAQVNQSSRWGPGNRRGVVIGLIVVAAVVGGVAYVATRDSGPGAETLPPISRGATLDRAQIRYCVAEDIRLEAARGAVPGNREAEVQRFNAMVEDYNGRCASFRYRSGQLQSVRSEVEARRRQLEMEGAARFKR